MAGKVRVQPASRVGLEPLVEMGEHLRSTIPGWEDLLPAPARPRVPSVFSLDLEHLSRHDLDGFLVASLDDTVVGFASSFVRSRQLAVGQPLLLPEYFDHTAAQTLLRRTMAYGERAGVSDAVALSLGGAREETLLFRFGLRPRFPVYRLRLTAERARMVGRDLATMLPGTELTQEGLERRTGAADLERLDRMTRGVSRPMDHEYWLGERRLRLALIRDGNRIAGYAYGGAGQCGPIAASTPEAALAAAGWALQLAADAGTLHVDLLVPSVFETGMEHLLDAGAEPLARAQWMSRLAAPGMERVFLASPTLY